MKELYSFSVKDEEGKSFRLILAKPTARQLEKADYKYSATLSSLIKQGILTRAMLYKKYEDSGGLLPEHIHKAQIENQKELFDTERSLIRLEAKGENKLTAKEKIEREELIVKSAEIRREMTFIENTFDSVYSHTAERLAQNNMAFWWMFELSYIQGENEETPRKIFTKETLEDNKDFFYDMEEDETKVVTAIKTKLFGLLSFWYYGQKISKDEMDAFATEYFGEESVSEEESIQKEEPAKPPKRRGKNAAK
jgi:hypothetical protein